MSEYELIPTDESLQATRMVPLQGGFNVRDMGGYPTMDGRFIKWGMMYRAGDLHRITEEDRLKLDKLHIKTTIDFRAINEAKLHPDQVLSAVVNSLHLPIDPANITELKHTMPKLDGETMRHIYHVLVREFQPIYAKFFHIIQTSNAAPILFHCSAGKDRTGFAAAMFLSALDVEREIIYADYMMSLDEVHRKYAQERITQPHLAPLLTVQRFYLQAAFDEIEQHWGGVKNYLRDCLNVDVARLKTLYTQSSRPKTPENLVLPTVSP